MYAKPHGRLARQLSRVVWLVWQPDPTAFLLRLRCLNALLNPTAPAHLFDQPAFQFLLFQVITGSQRVALQAWVTSNRPTVPAATTTRYVNFNTGNDSWDGTSATFVSGTTGPWATVGKANASATAGMDVIFEGTVSGSYISIDPPSGNASHWVRYKAGPGGATLTGAYCYLISKQYVAIEGLTIDGNSLGINACIYASGSPDIFIKDVTVKNANGIWIENGSHRAWIEACTFTDCGTAYPSNSGEGIMFKGAGQTDCVAALCIINNCGHMGFSCARSAAGAENITCKFILNKVHNRWAGGVAIGSASNTTWVLGNDIYESGVDYPAAGSTMGIQLQGIGALVRWNRIWGCQTQGITWFCATGGGYPGPVQNNKCQFNTFFDNGRGGQKNNLDVINRAGLDELEFNGNQFESNLVYNCGYFVLETQQAFIYIEIPSAQKFVGSSTSITIGTGSKTFTVTPITQSYWTWNNGDAVTVTDHGNVANTMTGTVTSYNSGTNQLVINVTSTTGSGTISSWDILGASIITYALNQWMPGSPSSTTRTLSGCTVKNNLFYRNDSTGTDRMIEYYAPADRANLGLGMTNSWYTSVGAEAAFPGQVSDNQYLVDPSLASVTSTDSNFLVPSVGSVVTDTGLVASGVSYNGAAPEIGFYEFSGGSFLSIAPIASTGVGYQAGVSSLTKTAWASGAGSHRYAVVGLFGNDVGGANNLTGITFGGQAMTHRATTLSTVTGRNTSYYDLFDAPAGSVDVTASASAPQDMAMVIGVWENVDSAGLDIAIVQDASAGPADTTLTTNFTPVTANAWAVCVESNYDGTLTGGVAGAGANKRTYEPTYGVGTLFDSGDLGSPAAKSMTTTRPVSSQKIYHIIGVVKPAAAPGGASGSSDLDLDLRQGRRRGRRQVKGIPARRRRR